MKTTINVVGPARIIINVVVGYYSLPGQLLVTEISCSTRNSGLSYAIFPAFSKSFLLHFLHKRNARSGDKISWWRLICMFLTIESKTTGQSSCLLLNLRTTTLSMWVPAIRLWAQQRLSSLHFLSRWSWPLLKITLNQQTEQIVKGIDVYMTAKPGLHSRIVIASLQYGRESL